MFKLTLTARPKIFKTVSLENSLDKNTIIHKVIVILSRKKSLNFSWKDYRPLPWQRWCDLSPLLFGTGLLIPYGLSAAIPCSAIVFLIAVLITFLAARRAGLFRFQAGLSCVTLLAGMAFSQWHLDHTEAIMLSRGYNAVRLTANVREVIAGEERQKLVLDHLEGERLEANDSRVKLRLSARNTPVELKVGDHIRFLATIFPPSRPSYPDGFDFGRYFAMRSIGGVGYVLGKPVVMTQDVSADSPRPFLTSFVDGIDQTFAAWRDGIQRYVMRILPQPEAGITLALITGQQELITPEVKRVMQVSSLAHMLAISGMNLVIACGMVFFLIRLCLTALFPFAARLPIKQIAAFSALISGAMYLLLADTPVSAARAYVMVACFFVAILFDREADSLRSLVLSAWIIMLANPESVTEISFQLSYIATLALILVYRQVRRMNEGMRARERNYAWRMGAYVGQMGFMSLVAGLATAPLMIYHFNQFTPYGVLANVLAEPPITFLTSPALIVALVAAPFGLADIPMRVAAFGVTMMIRVAEMTAAIPHANVLLPSISTPTLFLMLICLAAMLAARRSWHFGLCLTGLFLLGISGYLYASPDLLIAEDGSAVAVKQRPHQWLLLKGTARNFHVSQWQQATTDLFIPYASALKKGEAGTWQCADQWCDGKVQGRTVRVGFDYHTTAPLCLDDTDVVLTTFYSDRWQCGAKHATRIDRNSLQQRGSHAVWLEEKTPQLWYSCLEKAHQPWMRCSME